MMTVDEKTPVGRLVTERLDRSRVFDLLGIDYCCGGKTPLDQACREKGLGVEGVIWRIAESDARLAGDAAVDWSQAPMGALADHIVEVHHEYLRRELPRLDALLAKLVEAHGARHPELAEVRATLRGLKEELESHLLKEEKVLFPIVRQLDGATSLPTFHCGSVNNPIHVMEHEHDDAGAALRRLRSLTNGYIPPDDACTT